MHIVKDVGDDGKCEFLGVELTGEDVQRAIAHYIASCGIEVRGGNAISVDRNTPKVAMLMLYPGSSLIIGAEAEKRLSIPE